MDNDLVVITHTARTPSQIMSEILALSAIMHEARRGEYNPEARACGERLDGLWAEYRAAKAGATIEDLSLEQKMLLHLMEEAPAPIVRPREVAPLRGGARECRACGDALTDANWYPHHKRRGRRICRRCHNATRHTRRAG